MSPDHELSARIHASRRMVGKKVGTFGTMTAGDESDRLRGAPTSAAAVLGLTPAVRTADATADRNRSTPR
jgi:hypothetical protein